MAHIQGPALHKRRALSSASCKRLARRTASPQRKALAALLEPGPRSCALMCRTAFQIAPTRRFLLPRLDPRRRAAKAKQVRALLEPRLSVCILSMPDRDREI